MKINIYHIAFAIFAFVMISIVTLFTIGAICVYNESQEKLNQSNSSISYQIESTDIKSSNDSPDLNSTSENNNGYFVLLILVVGFSVFGALTILQYWHIDNIYGNTISKQQKIAYAIISISIGLFIGYKIGNSIAKKK